MGYAVRKDKLGFRIVDSINDISDFEEYSETQPEFLYDEELMQKINDALLYLVKTDHKDLPRYKAKDGEDLEAIYINRDDAREFVRRNSKWQILQSHTLGNK